MFWRLDGTMYQDIGRKKLSPQTVTVEELTIKSYVELVCTCLVNFADNLQSLETLTLKYQKIKILT